MTKILSVLKAIKNIFIQVFETTTNAFENKRANAHFSDEKKLEFKKVIDALIESEELEKTRSDNATKNTPDQ